MKVQLQAHDNTTLESFNKAKTLLGQAWAIIDELDTDSRDSEFKDLLLMLENAELAMEEFSFSQYSVGEEEFEKRRMA